MPSLRDWLSEHMLFIVFRPMFFQQEQEFFFKGAETMVFLLVIDIYDDPFNLRNADAECAVALLPIKMSVLRKGLVNPF
ncbi:hypothetical protein H206_05382 [Candidatus Electrothrix aarhusensis]|uniref:Uncharacterized protein n=1 Tax=Candidatus Electrothrix aarhusensis TaxID=1859131 RepID=A0A444J4N2_9BACT|nr:hypothetical protein H206_05382 [Candidatus Electrothrix aarhusensis]